MDALHGHFGAVTTHLTAPVIDLTYERDIEDRTTPMNTYASKKLSSNFVDLTQTDDKAPHPTPRKAIAAADGHIHPSRLALMQAPNAKGAEVSWGGGLEPDTGSTGQKAMSDFGSGQTRTTPRKPRWSRSQRKAAKVAKAARYRDGDVVGVLAPAISADNRGRAMLQKMGWTAGTALGTNGTVALEPVKHTIKTSRAGLAFVSEGFPQNSSAIRLYGSGTTLGSQPNHAPANDCTTEDIGIPITSNQIVIRVAGFVLLRLVQEEVLRQQEEDRWLLKLKKKSQKEELNKNSEMRRNRDIRCAAREQFEASAEGRALVKRKFDMLHKMRASTDPEKKRTLKLERRIVLKTLKARIQSAEAWAVAYARHANGERAGEVLQRTMSTATVKGTGSNTIPLGARQPGTQDMLHQYDGTHSSLHFQTSGGDSTPFAQRTSIANESIYEPMVSVSSPLHAPNSHMNSGFGVYPDASSGRRDSFTMNELANVMMDIDTGTM